MSPRAPISKGRSEPPATRRLCLNAPIATKPPSPVAAIRVTETFAELEICPYPLKRVLTAPRASHRSLGRLLLTGKTQHKNAENRAAHFARYAHCSDIFAPFATKIKQGYFPITSWALHRRFGRSYIQTTGTPSYSPMATGVDVP